MFKEVWCLTPYWKRLFIGVLLVHGAYNILFFDDYLNLWNVGLSNTEFFQGPWYYYSISYLPLLELIAGLLLIFGYMKKLVLGVIFYALLFAGYYSLDSNYILNFLIYFGMAFFSLFVLFGQYNKQCGDDTDRIKIPTGGM